MNQAVLNASAHGYISDAIELLLQKGEGKIYKDGQCYFPFHEAPRKVVNEYTHSFMVKYTRNMLTVTTDCMAMVLDNNDVVIMTMTAPAMTIRHSSTNVKKTEGTVFKVANNVRELYRISTTYQVKPPEKEERRGIFKDNAGWAIDIRDCREFVLELMSGLDYQVSSQGCEVIRLV